MKGSRMQEVVKMGYYEFREFLVSKGVLSKLEERINKRLFNNYGLLPKSYALDFENERLAYSKTLLKNNVTYGDKFFL